MQAAVAQLQHLTCRKWGQPNDRKLAQALDTRLIPHLTALTCLDLDFRRMSIAIRPTTAVPACFCQHINSMVNLQRLALAGTDPISSTTLPGIGRLTALEDLSLSICALEPSCLLPMTTGLTNLYLRDVVLQPSRAKQDSALAASQLLRLLAWMTDLKQLALERTGGNWQQQQLSAYSALTASSNLQDVIIHQCDIPSKAWVHVFPAGRTLPHLSRLSTATRPNQTGPVPFGSAGIASLVSCCPALQDMACKLAACLSLAPLQWLTALSCLHLLDVSSAAISQLAALTQLQELQVDLLLPGSPDPRQGAAFGLQHLVPFTTLTGLTELSCSVAYKQRQGSKVKPLLSLYTQAPAGAPPDVWVQLAEHCAAEDPATQQDAHELACARQERAELEGEMQALQDQLQDQLAVLQPQA